MYHDDSPCRLVSSAFLNATGCGTEMTVSDATFSGAIAASCQATAAPRSWPTTCTGPPPSSSINAITSAAR